VIARALGLLVAGALCACASTPAPPAAPAGPGLLRMPTRPLELAAGELPLRDLLGRWTDCGGPDVALAADLVDARIALERPLRIEPGEQARYVERALREHGLALSAAPQRPAPLVWVAPWPSSSPGYAQPVSLGPDELAGADAHPALLVRLVVPWDTTDSALLSFLSSSDGGAQVAIIRGPGCLVVMGPGREVANVARGAAALQPGGS